MKIISLLYPVFIIPALVGNACLGCVYENEEKAGREAVGQLAGIYEKSWRVVEKALSYLRENKPHASGFILCQFRLEPGKNDILSFYNEDGGRYIIKIKDKEMTISASNGLNKDRILGNCFYDARNDFVSTLTLPLRKTLEQGQGRISSLVIIFSMTGARIEADDSTGEGGFNYYYTLKDGKWTYFRIGDFDR